MSSQNIRSNIYKILLKLLYLMVIKIVISLQVVINRPWLSFSINHSSKKNILNILINKKKQLRKVMIKIILFLDLEIMINQLITIMISNKNLQKELNQSIKDKYMLIQEMLWLILLQVIINIMMVLREVDIKESKIIQQHPI